MLDKQISEEILLERFFEIVELKGFALDHRLMNQINHWLNPEDKISTPSQMSDWVEFGLDNPSRRPSKNQWFAIFYALEIERNDFWSESNTIESYGERLRFLRKRAGLTRADLAEHFRNIQIYSLEERGEAIPEKLGPGEHAIAYWEKSQRPPKVEFVLLYCEIFNVSMDWIFGLAQFAEFKTKNGSIGWNIIGNAYMNSTINNSDFPPDHFQVSWSIDLGQKLFYEALIGKMKDKKPSPETVSQSMRNYEISREAYANCLKKAIVETIRIQWLNENEQLAEEIKEAYGLKNVVVAKTPSNIESPEILDELVSFKAAQILSSKNYHTVCLGAGWTILRMIRQSNQRSLSIKQFVSGTIENHSDEVLKHHDANYIVAEASHKFDATGRYLNYQEVTHSQKLGALESINLSPGEIQAVFCSTLTILVNGHEIDYPGSKKMPKSADQILKNIYSKSLYPQHSERWTMDDIFNLTREDIESADIVYEQLGNLFSNHQSEIPESNNILSLDETELSLIALRDDSWIVAGGWWKAPAVYAAIKKRPCPTSNCLIIDSEIAKLLLQWS